MADNYLERKFEEMEKMKKRHSGYGRYGSCLLYTS